MQLSTDALNTKFYIIDKLGKASSGLGRVSMEEYLPGIYDIFNSINTITNKRKKRKWPQQYKTWLVTFFSVEILIYEKHEVNKTFTASASYLRLNGSFLSSFLYMDCHCHHHY